MPDTGGQTQASGAVMQGDSLVSIDGVPIAGMSDRESPNPSSSKSQNP